MAIDLLEYFFHPGPTLWDGPAHTHIPGGTMPDDDVDAYVDPTTITGTIELPLPGNKGDTTFVWNQTWPPPSLVAVVITQSGRFPATSRVLDAVEWISGVTMVPNADVAFFYSLTELVEPPPEQVEDELLEQFRTFPIARYTRTLGVTVGSP